MKLQQEFYKLPLTFDVERLKQEVEQFTDKDWTAHHENFKGNSAIPLIAVNGEFNNEFKGEMLPTPALDKCDYIKQVIASFGEVIGRSRLMRLAPGAEVPLHSDINYHWYKRVRIHIPITTEPSVEFHCGDKSVHMAAGECWIFDSWKYHRVVNASENYRVHLVIDIAGSSRFWELINEHSAISQNNYTHNNNVKFIPYSPKNLSDFITEKNNFPIIMQPAEIELLSKDLLAEVDLYKNNSAEEVALFRKLLTNFYLDWRELWAQFGYEKLGWPKYHKLREQLMQHIASLNDSVKVDDTTSATTILIHLILGPSMSTELIKTRNQSAPSATASATTKPPSAHLSRNSDCHCGSGKKFKHCHGQLN
ncbi:aspartyl/asparaginyl beta-hydroxylase domain-containing protein [Shewanella fidelis]|uniref:Aspartyl/asparaginyl beta-hydroxylase domain-containing protein n=1 Tax=Shewanella fidelis TaxID=173509 RepID=A0AAW8NN95_9GAMM|nr:aspartyl/asparaginyl beta-hydroxylase domain-containing protein [Shewanella fidelis]MDR8524187.1 aspartyl/asparaginyl beta-hydroxylase domain-containing protein [Shewanella fidelis]MDW4810734.1 aspartyl/asparaginyl beta-hydroxylase domain-containing protein [Shewanella fidelis]MDW4814855.1 aspartyl/asparaginyl beta-hydroxylase domain-containing protein [Shewanella fidelis]MDW4818945.1 aspartyl/asparaginyl beta-hydroxylase domain-containing protein [Shewanella fidelis]MDW4823378.1 aspartyl/a